LVETCPVSVRVATKFNKIWYHFSPVLRLYVYFRLVCVVIDKVELSQVFLRVLLLPSGVIHGCVVCVCVWGGVLYGVCVCVVYIYIYIY